MTNIEGLPLDVHIRNFEEAYPKRDWLIRLFDRSGWKYFASSAPKRHIAIFGASNDCICKGYGATLAEAFINMRRAVDNYEQQQQAMDLQRLREGIQK